MEEDVGFNKLFNSTKHKSCFFDDEECTERVIKAHSIQNNRILKKLSTDGWVIMIEYSQKRNNPRFKMGQVGRKKATTFTGFCGYHDNKIFIPIETKNYTKYDKEQEFLFAYRALAKEYNTKKNSFNYISRFFELKNEDNYLELERYFPQIKTDVDYLERLAYLYDPMIGGYAAALKHYERFRIAMKVNIETRNFNSIRTMIIEFPTESRIAVSSLINIKYDFEGKQLYQTINSRVLSSPCFLTIFPQEGKTYILMSYFNRMKGDYEFLKDLMLTKTIDEQKSLLSNLVIQYCENVVLSPDLWDSFSKEKQTKFIDLFQGTVLEKEKFNNELINIFE